MSDEPTEHDWMSRAVTVLRARRLDRIAVGYAVGGWVLVQAASIALPAFDVPPWGLRALIIFVLLGFPLVLAVAWFASPHVHIHAVQGRGFSRRHALLGLFTVIVVVIAGDLAYMLSRAELSAPGVAPAPVVALPPIARNSIAVLPFVNMSGDPAKDYFSDGISEELLNDLANTPALQVAARTSSFAFKGKNENIRDIARTLSVRTILEGSVRESGEHIRITGQLINADNGYHLWSATYDRNLTDVLQVQSEIAQAITAALTHRLLPAPRTGPAQAPVRAINPEAYRGYLLGKHQLAPRDQDGSEAALASFLKVTALAPDFADGFAALARAQINVADYHPERADLIPAAERALDRAIALDPRNVDALGSRLDLSLHKLDWQAAISDADLMRKVSPNSPQVLHELFRFYWFLGFPDLALAAANGAAKLDPLSFVDHLNIMSFLLHNGRFPEAAAAAAPALALQNDQPLILSMRCAAEANADNLGLARATETVLTAAGDSSNLQFCRFHLAIADHRTADAKAIADGLAKTYMHGGPSAVELGELYAITGDRKEAIRWLTRSYDAREYVLVLLPYEKIVPPGFFASAEWKAFYARPLFDDWRKAHDRIAARLAAQD